MLNPSKKSLPLKTNLTTPGGVRLCGLYGSVPLFYVRYQTDSSVLDRLRHPITLIAPLVLPAIF